MRGTMRIKGGNLGAKVAIVCGFLMALIFCPRLEAQIKCELTGLSSPTTVFPDQTNQVVWAAIFGGNYVAKINPSNCQVLARYPVGRGPFGVVAYGGLVWVTNYDDGTVSRIVISSGTVM